MSTEKNIKLKSGALKVIKSLFISNHTNNNKKKFIQETINNSKNITQSHSCTYKC